MKKISRSAMRQKAVANVLASLRMEQLTPSPSVVNALHGCVANSTSTDKLLADVLTRHVAPGRN